MCDCLVLTCCRAPANPSLQLLGKGARGVQHCRSSPDLAREGQPGSKQRAASGADPHRHNTDEGCVRGRHSTDTTPQRER